MPRHALVCVGTGEGAAFFRNMGDAGTIEPEHKGKLEPGDVFHPLSGSVAYSDQRSGLNGRPSMAGAARRAPAAEITTRARIVAR